ncbi:MAG: PIN domain-containing protein [Methylococcaceae bacterium]
MKYFVDTNIFIDLFSKVDEVKKKAQEKITDIAKQEDSALFVNRLVYLESLRTIPQNNSHIFRESRDVFDAFEFLDITQDIYDQAISFSRYCQSKGITLKGRCAAIDFLHFITAQYYQLELLSNDGDMAKLATCYLEWKEAPQLNHNQQLNVELSPSKGGGSSSASKGG